MKNLLFMLLMLVFVLDGAAFAGFLSGNATPYVSEKANHALELNGSILMAGTPFSILCLSYKYRFDDRLNLCCKYGRGTIDYTSISGMKLTTDPQLSGGSIDYILSGSREAEYYALSAEYETATWGMNKAENISNELMISIDYSFSESPSQRTRYRMALHNFNSGFQSEKYIVSSVKYSLSTEVQYNFNRNFSANFSGSIYFGDLGGLLATFGLGLGFNS